MTRSVVALVLVAVMACHRPPRLGERVRLGFFPTLTHGAALVGVERGTFARAIAPVVLETKAFSTGPEAIEALFAGALDACYVGPMPALNGYLRSHGEALAVVAGAATGGGALVVRREAGITTSASLHGKRLASPQLANTQDVALRLYLQQEGLITRDRGGDVQVMPIAAPDILSLMKRGALDGAWVPEPWVTRLIHEADAEILVEDRQFWPDMPSALLVASRPLLETRPDLVEKIVAAHVETVAWAGAHPTEARQLAALAIEKRGGKPLPAAQLAEAWARVELTSDPHTDSLARFAVAARRLGYLPGEEAASNVSTAVDRRYAPSASPQPSPPSIGEGGVR